MKARSRKSPATSGSFGTREISRSAAFWVDIRVFAATNKTPFPRVKGGVAKAARLHWGCGQGDLKSISRQPVQTQGKQATTNATNVMSPIEYRTASTLRQFLTPFRMPA